MAAEVGMQLTANNTDLTQGGETHLDSVDDVRCHGDVGKVKPKISTRKQTKPVARVSCRFRLGQSETGSRTTLHFNLYRVKVQPISLPP
jgi:hypothetical protein